MIAAKQLGMICLGRRPAGLNGGFFKYIRVTKNRMPEVLFWPSSGYAWKFSCPCSRSADKFFSKNFCEFRQVNFQAFKERPL